MEQHQRSQQRYERLLRERAAASLMREAAGALAHVSGHEATCGVTTIPQGAPQPAHQAADAMPGAGAHYEAAAPAPAAAASSSAGRHPQSQPLDLSRQTSHQWRPAGASGEGGATVRGAPHAHSAPAVGSSTTYAPAAIAFTAYVPVVGSSAFYAQATGFPATYSQAPRASAMYGQATGLSTSQAQQAGHSATYAHIAGQPPTYKTAQRKEHKMQPISFAIHQSPASSSYYYTDPQSTSTLRHGYYAPRMAASPSHQCPLVTSGSGERIYPQAGYPPAPSSVAMPSQFQTVPCYTIGGPQAYPPTIVYQQYWPATSNPQPASTHGHQPEPSRQKPTKRAVPSSGRSSPFLEPRYHRPVTPSTPPPLVQEGAVSSAGQPPSHEPVEATSEAHSNAMKSDPVKSEVKPLEMISVEVKQEDQGFDIPIKKEPDEEIKDVNFGEDKEGVKPTTEINPEANVEPVVGVDLKEDPYGEVEEDIDLEEYETGQEEDAKAGEESNCADGEDDQPGDATTSQQRGLGVAECGVRLVLFLGQVPLPPSAPWATVGGAGPLRGPRRNACRQCGRASIRGLLCYSCCWKPTPADGLAVTACDRFQSLIFLPRDYLLVAVLFSDKHQRLWEEQDVASPEDREALEEQEPQPADNAQRRGE
ncbi:uncharacterized protein LOC126335722 [Schistocerca gregaria]|uniref:uncharacterized protein LOC126335722 n=1 Tax=Schistocerca gregaria TaxID=7010 RepID=UPI00211DB9C3|nr:uncharacterized protein LOC126335722 [Schistocerca gregaria]